MLSDDRKCYYQTNVVLLSLPLPANIMFSCKQCLWPIEEVLIFNTKMMLKSTVEDNSNIMLKMTIFEMICKQKINPTVALF